MYFLRASGLTPRKAAKTPLPVLMGMVMRYINAGMGPRKKWAPQTKAKNAAIIMAAMRRLHNPEAVLKYWMKKLEADAVRAKVNQAPIMKHRTIAERLVRIAPQGMKAAARLLLDMAWMTAARSIKGLKGLAIRGYVNNGLRVSWQEHKTNNTIGRRDVVIPNSHITKFVKSRSLPQNTMPILPEKIIDKIHALSLKVMNNRAMTIRRSSLQEMYYVRGMELTDIMKISLHTQPSTLARYLATRCGTMSAPKSRSLPGKTTRK